MPQFLKNLFEEKDKKSVQILAVMFILGVGLLVARTFFVDTDERVGINVLPLTFDSPQQQSQVQFDEANNVAASTVTLSSYLTQQLEDILSLVAGAGNVRVMLSMGDAASIFAQNSQENVSATTEEDGEGGVRSIHTTNASVTYVMVRRGDGSEAPLLLQEIAPAIEGIIIVAQGGGDVAVRDALTRAAQAVLGVAPHRIHVLEMR